MSQTALVIRDSAGPLQMLLLRQAGEEEVQLTVTGAAPIELRFDGRFWRRDDNLPRVEGDAFIYRLKYPPPALQRSPVRW